MLRRRRHTKNPTFTKKKYTNFTKRQKDGMILRTIPTDSYQNIMLPARVQIRAYNQIKGQNQSLSPNIFRKYIKYTIDTNTGERKLLTLKYRDVFGTMDKSYLISLIDDLNYSVDIGIFSFNAGNDNANGTFSYDITFNNISDPFIGVDKKSMSIELHDLYHCLLWTVDDSDQPAISQYEYINPTSNYLNHSSFIRTGRELKQVLMSTESVPGQEIHITNGSVGTFNGYLGIQLLIMVQDGSNI